MIAEYLRNNSRKEKEVSLKQENNSLCSDPKSVPWNILQTQSYTSLSKSEICQESWFKTVLIVLEDTWALSWSSLSFSQCWNQRVFPAQLENQEKEQTSPWPKAMLEDSHLQGQEVMTPQLWARSTSYKTEKNRKSWKPWLSHFRLTKFSHTWNLYEIPARLVSLFQRPNENHVEDLWLYIYS